jgi:hypothetical protein
MRYQLLRQRGALQEGIAPSASFTASPIELLAQGVLTSGPRVGDREVLRDLPSRHIPRALIELLPESVARENCVVPVESNGEQVTLAAVDARDLPLADKLRFVLGVDVRLVQAPRADIQQAILQYYGPETESADSMLMEFTDTAIEFADAAPPSTMHRFKALPGAARSQSAPRLSESRTWARPQHPALGGQGMFYYTIPEGERVIAVNHGGRMQELIGPQRVWIGWRRFLPMQRHVAHPGEFLIVRYLDGRQEHVAGPAEVWFDLRRHESIEKQDCLQLAAKEAVVAYRQGADGGRSTIRRIVYGPTLFYPEPGEWLHTFSWHASQGGARGVEKVPKGLVFQKLWLMPDQMYHDVHDVRTADGAVLIIRLMIFFELADIERMLDNTHDPIGDFVNAATADVVELVGKHEFDSFKVNTDKLNDVATYKQLLGRAAQSGYRITNVVYRGYGAAASLQQMHDQAIEARTKLQLERETEEQAQGLEDFKLESQLTRAGRRRSEQTEETRHLLDLSRQKTEADLENRAKQAEFQRAKRLADAHAQEEAARLAHAEQQMHYRALGELGVNLTEYLTQSRADRVIEFRGAGGTSPHVHLDGSQAATANNGQ